MIAFSMLKLHAGFLFAFRSLVFGALRIVPVDSNGNQDALALASSPTIASILGFACMRWYLADGFVDMSMADANTVKSHHSSDTK